MKFPQLLRSLVSKLCSLLVSIPPVTVCILKSQYCYCSLSDLVKYAINVFMFSFSVKFFFFNWMLHLAFMFCLLGSEVPLEELANLIIDPSSRRRMDKVISYMSPFLLS